MILIPSKLRALEQNITFDNIAELMVSYIKERKEVDEDQINQQHQQKETINGENMDIKENKPIVNIIEEPKISKSTISSIKKTLTRPLSTNKSNNSINQNNNTNTSITTPMKFEGSSKHNKKDNILIISMILCFVITLLIILIININFTNTLEHITTQTSQFDHLWTEKPIKKLNISIPQKIFELTNKDELFGNIENI